MPKRVTTVAYVGLDEVLVIALEHEAAMLREYFGSKEDNKRCLDEYDRETYVEGDPIIITAPMRAG